MRQLVCDTRSLCECEGEVAIYAYDFNTLLFHCFMLVHCIRIKLFFVMVAASLL